jgi:hypothetical protein
MFPTEPIRNYINLSFAKKSDELAKAYAAEVTSLNTKSPPNSGMYFNALMLAGVQQTKSRIDAWVEVVRAACKEASRPIDDEVRNYVLGEVHGMCEAAKGHIARSLRLRLSQSGMQAAPNLEQSLVANAERQVLGIQSGIKREFKIEELKEQVKKGSGREASPTAPEQRVVDAHEAGDRIELPRGSPKASSYYWQFLKRFGEECYRTWRREIFVAVIVNIITFFLIRHDKNAWGITEVALEANLYLFSIFAAFHLVRTPYLLHRERPQRAVHWRSGLFGLALLLLSAGAFSRRVVSPWVFQTANVTVTAPPAPTITQEPRQHSAAISPPREPANVTPQTGPLQHTTPNAGTQPAGQSPVQPSPQVAQGTVAQTQLERLIQTDRNLTSGDRERLSNALYECAQFLEQGMTLGYRMNSELGKVAQDRTSGSLAKNYDGHIAALRDIGNSGTTYSKGFAQIREKWKYYPEQTEYIFGENPDNLGPNALINSAVGFANYLGFWSKIANKDQQDVLTLVAIQQSDYAQYLTSFFHWAQGSEQRLNQVKQSIEPNGVVQPIPSSRPAPAFFMMN